MGVINTKYIRHVIDYMPELLPYPTPKNDILNIDLAETINELPIIKVRCELNYGSIMEC